MKIIKKYKINIYIKKMKLVSLIRILLENNIFKRFRKIILINKYFIYLTFELRF